MRSSKKSLAKKRAEREEAAAARTLNGNGSYGSLPPSSSNLMNVKKPHPYGVKPYGNIYSSEKGDEVRWKGLGPSFRHLNDELLLSLAGFCDAASLGNLSRCSRFCYVWSHQEELWRDLCLKHFSKATFTNFDTSWKQTLVQSIILSDTSKSLDNCNTSHKPISVGGIFSDVFYRSFLCRHLNFNASCLSVENVSKENGTKLTVEDFLNKYERPNVPVVIDNVSTSWPAMQKWEKDYLKLVSNGSAFRATSGTAPLPASFNLHSYFQYCDSVVNLAEEAPLYLFDRSFDKISPQLLNDYQQGLYKVCPFFSPEAEHGHDLFGLLGESRPDFRWIIMGPKQSGSCFHIDPNATHAWNAPIRGKKRWIFYPPGVPPPGVMPSSNGDDVTMPISVGEWFLTFWSEHLKERNNPDVSKRPLECTVEPGQILFVPHGWWHTVVNLDDGLSIALTQNYCSQSNLSDVLRFLRTKEQQISGCRDRADAVKPEKFYDEFMSALQEKRPDLLTPALEKSMEGWECAAWNDVVEDEDRKHLKRKRSVLDKAKSRVVSDDDERDEKKSKTELATSRGFTFSFF